MATSSLQTRIFPVTGLMCANCALHTERALRGVDGVSAAACNFATLEAQVTYDPRRVTPQQLASAVEAAGYHLVLDAAPQPTDIAEVRRTEYAKARRRALWAVGLTLPVMVLNIGFATAAPWVGWVLWALATPVVFGAGRQFFVGAWRQLRHRTANMDTLVALSTGISYALSVFNLLLPDVLGAEAHLYFDSSCGIVMFILLGRLLEARAKAQTATSLTSLMGLRPQVTTRLVSDAATPGGRRTEEVPIGRVCVGDVLLVKPGSRIPVDGAVTEGQSYVDESLLTGEPLPALKAPGAAVYEGTLNGRGALQMRAAKVGAETTLARIIRTVREAQNSKAPVQRTVDRVAAVFVPCVIGIALLAFGLWMVFGHEAGGNFTRALLSAVTVLVVACPCALGLATPTALMVGIGRAATKGILVKDAESLELACRIRQLVVDKTGTLTEGKPRLRADDAAVAPGDANPSPSGLKSLTPHQRAVLLALESRSEHPVAQAIAAALKGEKPDETANFEALVGRGVRGESGGATYFAGNARLMREMGIEVNEAGDTAGTTVVYYGARDAAGARLLTTLRVADRVKAGTPAALASLAALGIEVHLLSGDSEAATAALARQLGLHHWRGGVLPEQKAAYVRELKAKALKTKAQKTSRGGAVAMAGDGINDSAALAEADVSIAMGGGADVAMDVAQMTIVSSDLRKIPEAVRLSRRTRRVVRQNLFWAFIYNATLLPIAAGALIPLYGFALPPSLAAAAMALSSLSVVTNSLRLRRA